MTTTQESPNGQRVSPFPSSVENPAELDSADLPADQDHNKPFAASAYHVPPGIYVPKAHAYRNDDHVDRPHLDGSLPDRCQFMFSDGRQCTMARSDIHPSLCFYHADREEQLFGDPSYRVETRKLDFPELFSACRDLSTAAGVNRALAQVFRLLAQRRISRQEAATFGNLAKLLLRTISLMNAVSQSDEQASVVIPSEYHERGIPPEVLAHHKLSARPAGVSSPVILSESALSSGESLPTGCAFAGQERESKRAIGVPVGSAGDLSVPLPASADSPTPPLAASPSAPTQRVAMSNPRKISTSAPFVPNSPEISTYKNTQLDPTQNQHLQKSNAACSERSGRT